MAAEDKLSHPILRAFDVASIFEGHIPHAMNHVYTGKDRDLRDERQHRLGMVSTPTSLLVGKEVRQLTGIGEVLPPF
jgi:hypothetical protein